MAAACARLGLRTALISVLPSDHAWGDRTIRELPATGWIVAGCSAVPASAWGSTSSSTAWPRARCGSSTTAAIPRSAASWRRTWTGAVRRARLVHLTGVTAALGDNIREVVRRAVAEAAAARRAGVVRRELPLAPVEPEGGARLPGRDPPARALSLHRRGRRGHRVRAGGPAGARAGGAAAPRALGHDRAHPGRGGRRRCSPTSGVHRPSKLYTVSVVDRVGAGDAFAAGFLWATLTGRDAQQAMDAATALAALKCTIWGDVPW